jgi:TP901 family phage tail tape measure protein
MRQGFETASQAAKAFMIILKDMFSVVGFLNTAMSIMLSRFGTMIIIFGVVTLMRRLSQAVKDSERTFDTASRKLRGIVIPTFGDLDSAITSLNVKLFDFIARFGVSTDQLSDTMFFLASAGRTHAQILSEVIAVQKLVIATSKDMQATNQDNKVLVEAFVGILNLYGTAIKEMSNEQERAEHLASVLFGVFKTEQILITELATGLSFAANQARAMNISVEELIVSIAALNTSMIKGSKAGTSYANALRDAIKNSDKLQKNFGINIGNIAEGFSFLETVVGPISEQMREASNLTEFHIRLLETFNIRGTRAVLALANAYEKNIEKTRSLETANRDLEDAFIANADSMIQQEQRLSNLKSIYAFLFATIVTGGRGQALTLKQINNNLDTLGRSSAGAAARILRLTSTMRTNYELGLLRLQYQLRAIPVFGRFIKKFVEARDIGKGLIETQERYNLLLAFHRGELTKVQFEQEMVNRGFVETEDLIKGQGQALKSLVGLWDAYTKALDRNIKISDEFGEVGIDRVLSALGGRRELFAKFQAPSLIDPKEIEAFVQNLDRQLSFAERSFIETARVIDEQAFQAIRKAAQKANDERDKLVGAKETIAKAEELIDLTLAFRIIDIVTQREKDKRDIIRRSLSDQLDIIREGNRRILDEAKKAREFSRVLVGELDVKQFLDRRRPLEELEDITFLPRISRQGLEKIEQINTEVLAAAGERLLKIREQQLGIRLDLHSATLDMIDDAEGRSGRARIRLLVQNADRVKDITKAERNRLNNLADERLEKLKAIVEIEFQSERDILINQRKAAEQWLATQEKIVDGYAAREAAGERLNEVELAHMKKVSAESEIFRNTIVFDLIKAWEALEREIERTTQDAAGDIRENLGKAIDETNEKMRELKVLVRAAFSDLQFAIDAQVESFRTIANIIDDLAELTGNKQKESLAALLSTTLNTLGSLITVWSDYKNTVNSTALTVKQATDTIAEASSRQAEASTEAARAAFALMSEKEKEVELLNQASDATLSAAAASSKAAAESAAAAAKISATLAVLGLVISATVAIVSLFKKDEEDRNELQQEFLDQEAVRAVSPDYGQARVVNNRITLVPTFQLLDPTQLTADAQRRIALTIFDELQEIEKSLG